MRADGWNRIPIIRMTNVNLEPGEWAFDDLIADTDDGIYMELNKSWSIDDKRLNFQFGTEIACEIKNGKLGADAQERHLHRHHPAVLGQLRRHLQHRPLERVGHAQLRQGPAAARWRTSATAQRRPASATSASA